ncbi:MAG: type II toxin-antitoxin system VapB family antitoxin [Acidobacteriota bacterium]
MAMNIKNDKVERLAEELAHMTGESKTAAILRALEERKDRIALGPSGKRRLAQALDFLEREIWPNIPRKLLGRRVTKRERERILGYGRGGVATA